MMCAMNVLLIEDHEPLRQTLTRSLRLKGLQVHEAADGPTGLDTWRRYRPDAVILDLSLPGLDGLEVLTQARAAGLATPVLILTARSTISDRILGLNTGADDYLAKPFDLDELEARLRALTRRLGVTWESEVSSHFCGLSVDPTSGAILREEVPQDFPPREAACLKALLTRPGQAFSKEQLFEAIFAGEDDIRIDAVEVVAYRLRKRLGDWPVELVTLRGLGYLLRSRG